jgi:hypothetical protein
MAIDQSLVALDIAGSTVTLAGQLVETLEALDSEYNHGVAAGINLVSYNTQFEASDPLKHVDGATLNQVLATVGQGLIAYLNTQVVGGSTWMQVLQKARR